MTSIIRIFFSSLCGLLLLTGCGRQTSDLGQVRLQLSLPDFESSNLSEPLTLSEFDCFGVFLIHPTASQNPNQCKITSSTAAAGSSIPLPYQQFLGGYFKGDPIEFEVANGRDRTLQLVGFKTNFGANIDQARDACAKYSRERLATFSQLYILGKSEKFDILPGATTNISIQANFIATLPEIVSSCFGAEPPSTIPTAGPPVLARLTLQDGITELTENVCVGGMLELLDNAGQLANVTEDIQIQLNYGVSGSKFYRNFELCTTSFGADPLTLNFYDTPGRFNQIPIFFKPGGASVVPITLSKVTGPATLLTTSFPLTSQSSGGHLILSQGPQLQIFDSFSNRSTKTSSTSTPIPVRRLSCRSAQIQLVGTVLPPQSLRILDTGGSSASVIVTAIKDGAGDFQFFPNKNCQATATLNTISLSILPGIDKPYVGEFSYIAPDNIDPNFRLDASLSLMNGANYYGVTIDSLTANNYFQVVE